MMSGEGYLRPGSGTEFQFSAGGGKWRCVMTEKVAGCVGAVPEAGKDGVEVTAGGKAGYVDDGAARFAIAGAVKELPVGRSLPNGKFVCTPFAEGAGSSGGGVQCETAAADHGFQMLEGQARFW